MRNQVMTTAVLALALASSGAAIEQRAQTTRAAASTKQSPARYERYQVAAGSALLLKLRTPLNSASASVDDQVEATLWSPVIQEGVELVPAGSVVFGRVLEVLRASERQPVGAITFAFSIIEHAETGSREALSTRRIVVEAPREPEPQRGRRKGTRKPIDAEMATGAPFVAMTAEPLVVLIPR
jgi:hypothetical protein